MKFRYLAIAAACAAIAGQAHAATGVMTAAQANAAQLKLFISGSSALQKVIEGVLTQNCATDKVQFKSQYGSAAAPSDTTNGNSHNIYACTLTGNDFGTANVGKTIMLVKREAGGSAYGVFPVAANTVVPFMDISTCSDAAATCTGLVSVKPDAGVSDLEPAAFNSAVNRPVAFGTQTVVASQFASSGAVAEQVFGLVVNANLYAALLADQGLTTPSVPSVSSAAFTSLYIAGAGQSGLGWAPLLSSGNVTSQVNICARALGSGTRASAQLQFLQSPSNIFPLSFANPAVDNSTGAVKGAVADSAYFVSEESSSGNVIACVQAANATGAYSIGMVSVDRDMSTYAGAYIVKLDNQTANSSAAKNGQYPWVFEAFYNVNKTAPNLAIAKAFGTAFALPININAISAAAKNGVMATPENCQGDGSAAEVAVCSRVSRNQDSRQPLVFIR